MTVDAAAGSGPVVMTGGRLPATVRSLDCRPDAVTRAGAVSHGGRSRDT